MLTTFGLAVSLATSLAAAQPAEDSIPSMPRNAPGPFDHVRGAAFEVLVYGIGSSITRTFLVGMVAMWLLFYALKRAGYSGTQDLLAAVVTERNIAAAIVVSAVVLSIAGLLVAIVLG